MMLCVATTQEAELAVMSQKKASELQVIHDFLVFHP